MNRGRRGLWIVVVLLVIGALIATGVYLGGLSGRSGPTLESTVLPTLAEKLETAAAIGQLPTGTLPPTSTPRPTSTPTKLPTSTPTPTPQPTITPNIPQAARAVATAKPKQVTVFTRPQPVIPSVLAFINETGAQLLIFLQGVEDPITLMPDAFTERQLAPGEYDYTVMGRAGGLGLLTGHVTLESNERIEITIKSETFCTLSFENQTDSPLTVTLADTEESIDIPAGTTSVPRPLPPGRYVYTAFTGSGIAALTDEVTLEAGDAVTIVIKPGDVFNATLSVENQTDYNLTVTLAGIATPIVVAPRQTSEELPLLSGEYDYTVVATPGNISTSGHLSVADGEHYVLTVDITTVASELAAFVIENRTAYELVASFSGLPWTITIPPHSTSEERQFPPGEYSYTVETTGGNIAPLSGHVTLEKGILRTLVIELPSGPRSEVTIINDIDCPLTIELSGPEELTVNIPAGSRKVINIASGEYTYTARACSASTSGTKSFSGKSSWTFYLS